MCSPLALVALPLLGFLLNGVLGTRLPRSASFVTVVACGCRCWPSC
jgi:hypothetical protein